MTQFPGHFKYVVSHNQLCLKYLNNYTHISLVEHSFILLKYEQNHVVYPFNNLVYNCFFVFLYTCITRLILLDTFNTRKQLSL